MDLKNSSSSSTSSAICRWSHDVFLSFRGEDTRFNFTSHLFTALHEKGLNVFIDDGLRRGEEISAALLKTIEESRISIVIFSKDYASSAWCLNELLKIMECKESRGQIVLPVFYDVDPSVVRKQTCKYGEAMAKHEDSSNVQSWRQALTASAHLSGWHLEKRNEADLIRTIVQEVMSKLSHRMTLHVAKYPVGIDAQVQNIKSLLNLTSNKVHMVGIHGMGGIGKTTLAKALFNEIANRFEGCSFLGSVRETSKQFCGIVKLQETLLYETLGDINSKVVNHDRGINIIKERLRSKRILLILDDVDDPEQLEALVGGHEWFGSGSRIIATTRDKHLLSSHGFDVLYGVRELDCKNAIELFNRHAFRNDNHLPSSDFYDLSKRVVNYCEGLPLALVVLGSFLCTRDECEWRGALNRFEKVPNSRIQEILRVSFDGLEDNVKSIFLDISCFLVGEDINEVKSFFEACDFDPSIGIRVLIDMSLITIEWHTIKMHNLIQQMGREVVRKESSEPGKRSRLWLTEEVMDVLIENKGTNAIECIKLEFPNHRKLNISNNVFKNMKNLRLLIVRNAVIPKGIKNLPNQLRWLEFPGFTSSSSSSVSRPLEFHPRKLIKLDMQHSFIQRLGTESVNLKYVNLSSSKFLEEIPDFSTASMLEELILKKCTNLTKIHDSIGCLSKLVTLNLESCSNLNKLPSNLKLKSLRHLNLSHCCRLEQFPDIIGNMECLKEINLESTLIKELPSSISNLSGLEALNLRNCKELEALPTTILLLSSLRYLYLVGCSKLRSFRYPRSHLNWLDLRYCDRTNDLLKALFPSLFYLDITGNKLSDYKYPLATITKRKYFCPRSHYYLSSYHYHNMMLESKLNNR